MNVCLFDMKESVLWGMYTYMLLIRHYSFMAVVNGWKYGRLLYVGDSVPTRSPCLFVLSASLYPLNLCLVWNGLHILGGVPWDVEVMLRFCLQNFNKRKHTSLVNEV